MDKNVILAVFLLFFVVADVSNTKFRYLAAVDPNDNPATTEASGANKPVEGEHEKKPETVDSPSQLDTNELSKRDLVSPPPPNEITDNSKSSNSTDSVNPTVQNKTIDNPNGSNNTDNSKNSKRSNGKDSTMSPPDKEKSTNNSSDAIVSTQVKGTDNGKNEGTELEKNGRTNHEKKDGTDNGKKDGTDSGKKGSGKKSGTDVGKKDETDSRKEGTDSGKKDGTDSRKEGTDSGKKEGTNSGKEGIDSGKKDGEDSRKEGIDSGKKDSADSRKEGIDSGKKDETKENNNEDKRDSEPVVDETCRGLPNWCNDMSGLIACIKNFDTGSRKWTVLVQNEGEKTLIVNLAVPTAAESPLKQLEMSKHQTRKIIISEAVGKSNKVIFTTRSGKCVLHMNSLKSGEKFFVYLPSYDNLLTPINGAYFLILSVLIFGGTWACCKLRKRRRHDGVAYQELEMGLPESVSATNVETAEGWDEGWDDDWDDDNAVRSPGAPHMGNISANGLTSRSTVKDGWEHDWDD